MTKQCNCGEPVQHAKAVADVVMQSLFNAMNDPEREPYWRLHADKLEGMFTTQHGKHYSELLAVRK